jgi:hypothetical protein
MAAWIQKLPNIDYFLRSYPLACTIDVKHSIKWCLSWVGMWIREYVALWRKHFQISHQKRIRIDISAIMPKTKTAHTTFVSNEASKCLIPHLKTLTSEDLVFGKNQDPCHTSMTKFESFTRYRDSAGMTDMSESANCRPITLYSFISNFSPSYKGLRHEYCSCNGGTYALARHVWPKRWCWEAAALLESRTYAPDQFYLVQSLDMI